MFNMTTQEESRIYLIKDIQFDAQDMEEFYKFSQESLAPQPNCLSRSLSIANAIHNILRQTKHKQKREALHNQYEKSHLGHIKKINQLAQEFKNESEEKDATKYEELEKQYNVECAEAVLSYLKPIDDAVMPPLKQYIEDYKKPCLPQAVTKSL
jgi:hypothetical protein